MSQPGPTVRNKMSGNAVNVVQAGSIGSVVFNAPAAPAAIPALAVGPPDPFTDREGELTRIRQLADMLNPSRIRPVVVGVHGDPGIGKTALLRHVSASLGELFPDGSLSADCGPDGDSPSDAVMRLLIALGVPEPAIPSAFAARTDLYRSLTARRRFVVLIDNVRLASEVTPLLPNSGASLVLVAGREPDFLEELQLDGVAFGVDLRALPPADAVRMLDSACEDGRIAAEPQAARELAAVCGGVPLALRLVSARLVMRPEWSVRKVVEELRDPSLDGEVVSTVARRTVRRTYELTYTELPAALRELYRMLGVLVGTRFEPELIAAMVDRMPEDVRPDLTALQRYGLIEPETDSGYRMHWMLRVHALERSQVEDTVARRQEWLRRAIRWWLLGAVAADLGATGEQRLRVGDPRSLLGEAPITMSVPAALAWLDREQPNILRAMRAAAENAWHDEVWQLFEAMFALYDARRPLADWVRAGELGVESARLSGNVAAEARCRCLLAKAYQELENYSAAHALLDRARELALDCDERLVASTYDFTGNVHLRQGEDDIALGYFRRALEINERLGLARGTALQSMLTARALGGLGEFDESLALLGRARAIAESAGAQSLLPKISLSTAHVLRKAGQTAGAEQALRETVLVAGQLGHTAVEADALRAVAELLERQGNTEAALESRRRAARAYEKMGSPHAARILAGLPPA